MQCVINCISIQCFTLPHPVVPRGTTTKCEWFSPPRNGSDHNGNANDNDLHSRSYPQIMAILMRINLTRTSIQGVIHGYPQINDEYPLTYGLPTGYTHKKDEIGLFFRTYPLV